MKSTIVCLILCLIVLINSACQLELLDTTNLPSVSDSEPLSKDVEPAMDESETINEQKIFLDMLSLIPDTEEYKGWITYGSPANWYEERQFERPSIHEAELTPESSMEHQNIFRHLETQILRPDLFHHYDKPMAEKPGIVGFSYSSIEHALVAHNDNNSEVVIAKLNEAGVMQVRQLLLDAGYTTASIFDEEDFFHIRDDYEGIPDGPIHIKDGEANRVWFAKDLTIFAAASSTIDQIAEAKQNSIPALNQDPKLRKIVEALTEPELEELGSLVSIILSRETIPLNMFTADNMTVREVHKDYVNTVINSYPIPEYEVLALSARRQPGTTYLIASVGFSSTADVASVTESLAIRLEQFSQFNYSSRPLADSWSLHNAYSSSHGDIAVSHIVMKVWDPLDGEDPSEAFLLAPSWFGLILLKGAQVFLLPNTDSLN